MKQIVAPTLRLGPASVRIAGSASAFPDVEMTTEALVDRLALDVPLARRRAMTAFFDQEVGVHRRAHLVSGLARDLALVAARRALEEASVRAPAALVYATSTPSRWTAAESALLARDLDLTCAFFDVRSGCTGGLHALVHAARLARDADGPVLVVAADAFSKTFGNERLLPVTMGDGAAALVLVPSDRTSAGVVRAVFGGAPDRVDLATVQGALPPTSLDPSAWALSGDPTAFAEAAEAALLAALTALEPPASATIVVHTSRAATARRVAGAFGRAPYLGVLENHGNLGAPTLLAALDRLRREQATHDVALVSAGGGLSFGAALFGMAS